MRTLFARATAVAASAMLASAALALPAYADVKTFPTPVVTSPRSR